MGVIFNDKLSWKSHIQHVCSKLSNGSWALLKLRNYVDNTTPKTVYYTLIYSYVQYCVSTWGLASTTALDPLVRIHKRIIRIITNSPFLSHTNPLFQKLNFLKIKDIVKLEMAKTTFCFNKISAKNESQTIVSIIFFFSFRPFLLVRGGHSVLSFSTSFCLQCPSPSHQLPPYLLLPHLKIFSLVSLFSSFLVTPFPSSFFLYTLGLS